MSFCHFCLSGSKKYLSTDETDTFLLQDAVFLFFWAKELPLLHFTFQLFRSFVQVFARWLPRVRRGGQMRRNFWPSQFVFMLRRTAFLFFPAFDQFDFRKKWKKVASFRLFSGQCLRLMRWMEWVKAFQASWFLILYILCHTWDIHSIFTYILCYCSIQCHSRPWYLEHLDT